MGIFRVHIIIPELPKHSREHISRQESPTPHGAVRKAMQKFVTVNSPAHSLQPTAWVFLVEKMKQEDGAET